MSSYRGILALIAAYSVFSIAHANELLFLQAVWNSGDHNPTRLCPNDVENGPATWKQGLGWLTTRGMAQHFQLGSFIYDEYARKQKFLSEVFDPREIHVRSADTNRSLLSASSNMLGMYTNRAAHKPDIDFPADRLWPKGFVPVAIHTDKPEIDYVFNMADCKRQDFLIDSVKHSPEYTTYESQIQDILQRAKEICGEPMSIFDVSTITQLWLQENVENRTKLCSEEDFRSLREVERMAVRFLNGENVSDVNNITLSTELSKLRVGSLIWDIIDHMDLKMHCSDADSQNVTECGWMSKLKYYSYSASDEVISGLASAFSAGPEFLSSGLPQFADCMIFELWNVGSGYGVKIKYYSPNETLKELEACRTHPQGVCPISQLKSNMTPFKLNDAVKHCADVPSGWVRRSQQTPKLPVLPAPQKPMTDDGDHLIFVQSLWRHGDRSPRGGCPNDKNAPDSWYHGAGQLTALGMSQHMMLGSLIYDKYVTQLDFLSPKFDSSEIYIHSTGFNRTVVSAIANFVGMYSNRSNLKAGIDYPDIDRWPSGYVPVPVHNIDRTFDHMGDPDAYCPRQRVVTSFGANSSEIRLYEFECQNFLATISRICGKRLGLMDLAIPIDTNLIEGIHGMKQLFDQETYLRMRELNAVAENVRNGLLAYNFYRNGFNLRTEIPRLRGGSVLWNVIDHLDLKIHCLEAANAENPECEWIRNLKYFVFSAHDSTVNGLLSTLGLKERVVPDGVPEYTAAVMVELWKGQSGYKIKVNFHRSHKSSFWEDITSYVSGCPQETFCPYDVFKNRSLPFHPGDIRKECYNIPYVPDEPTQPPQITPLPSSSRTATLSKASASCAARSFPYPKPNSRL